MASRDDLKARLDAIVKQEGVRQLPVAVGPAFSATDATGVVNDRFLGDKQSVVPVKIMVEDEVVIVFVRAGDEPKVVGFKD